MFYMNISNNKLVYYGLRVFDKLIKWYNYINFIKYNSYKKNIIVQL